MHKLGTILRRLLSNLAQRYNAVHTGLQLQRSLDQILWTTNILSSNSMGFFLNDFPRIQRIQWIIIKSKNSMITGYILHLTMDTFLDVVVKNDFPLLSVGWYLFRVVTGNRNLPRGSNKNTLYTISTSNVSVARWVIPLVTIPLLD